MPDLMELFAVLDDWDSSRPPQGIELSPDPALRAARLALEGKEDPQTALRKIEEQIATYRPLRRALAFNLVDPSQSTNALPLERMLQLGVDLHTDAALLAMRLSRWEEARSQLLQAVALNPQDATPRFRFVELYETTGAFADAFSLLQNTFDTFSRSENGRYQLYSLCLSIQRSGALEDARGCYNRLIARDPADIFAGLARLQVSRLDGGSAGMPPDSELESLYHKSVTLMINDDPVQAAHVFTQFLSWVPHQPICWYGLGSACQKQALRADRQRGPKPDLSELSEPDRLNEADYKLLLEAEQAFRLAGMLKPDLAIAHDGLANCLLRLERPAEAQEAILVALKADATDPIIFNDAARIFLANGNLRNALTVLQASLRIDPNQPEVTGLLNRLARLVPPENGAAHRD